VLDAVQLGIYEHCPGDGRERVVSRPQSAKIRAEDGRRVARVNIGAFIRDLPGGRSTAEFTSDNASGSTSQAANIVEALEMGADVLLIDEDTSATNFMIRGARMQQLIAREPIVPFIDRVGELARDKSVSTVMVVGGAGDYLDVADTVILMENYRAYDVTERAAAIAGDNPSDRRREVEEPFGSLAPRRPLAAGLDPSRGKRDVKIAIRSRHHIEFGTWPIDLSALEQLAAKAQTRAIGEALVLVKRRLADGRRSMEGLVRELDEILATEGVDALDRQRRGDLAEVRGMEIIAALNRLRSLALAD
jgi:predicted ABC-class ATPase